MVLKISHKVISLHYLEDLFKEGVHSARIQENPLWKGAVLIHSYIDHEKRNIHLFFEDSIGGKEITEGQDILYIEETLTVFRSDI